MKNNNSSNSPSFSSSLLEQIYRSFDDGVETDFSHSRRSKLPKRFNSDDHFTARDFDSRFVLEQWMDKEEKKKRNENLISPKFRRNSMPEDGRYRHPLYYSSSSTSSSDSSSGIGGFSSSDTDSLARMKPIRTAVSSPEFNRKSNSGEIPAKKKSKKEGKLQHALKLYGDLKKVKQPISPGGKLASFLNSLFNSGNSKKPKFEKAATSSPAKMTSSSSVSVPSTASSYSRSCLSKTPSSAGRFERRSVRFCPVSVVVDETGQKLVYNDTVSKMEVCNEDNDDLKLHIMEKQRRVEEAAKELLKNYRNKQNRKELKVNIISPNHGNNNNNNNNNNYSNNINGGFIKGNNKWDNSRNNNVNLCGFEDGDEDEDDEESCCSSDLFELENILEVGATDKYCQELPVYETTHVSINRAIANGSIL